MLNIKLICVGKLKELFYEDACGEYIKRLTRYCKLELVEISEYRLPNNPSDAQILNALGRESSEILNLLPDGAFAISLCVEGREMDSLQLSSFLSDCANNALSRLCFIIGGSNGLHNDVKKASSLSLSMSKMTFPHTLARVMLLEQLYRAFSILEGGKYHK
ncbi:MAG: 23S rRNA (pseudouridine(1915)-N(3))-methyltransferase RlmH [Oscillospiraceae bacterium]|nr:23S rRNA (pseudouridine(1915)-N(3))-methyltransferase RlmH [Oscillospiraceae bacterium]